MEKEKETRLDILHLNKDQKKIAMNILEGSQIDGEIWAKIMLGINKQNN